MKYEVENKMYGGHLFLTDDIDELIDRIKRDVPEYEADTFCTGKCSAWNCETTGQLTIGIFATSIPAISHEAVHAANEIFLHIGQEYDIQNDECFCYLVEWIVKEWVIGIYLKQGDK